MKNRKQKPIALTLFLFSGFLSLIFQVVWLKKLVLVFGNTVWAVSTFRVNLTDIAKIYLPTERGLTQTAGRIYDESKD